LEFNLLTLNMLNNVVIVSAKRTPIGNFRGKLSSLSAVEIGSITLNNAIESVKLNPNLIDELIIGHVLQAGCGQAPAKQLAYKSGINMKTPCTSINKVCSSGIKAVSLAAQSIELGINEIVVAGGIECMSQAPYYIKNKKVEKIENSDITNGLFYDGLTDFKENTSMGVLAEICAKKYNISREMQDEFTNESFIKTLEGYNKEHIKRNIIKINTIDTFGKSVLLEKDENLSKYNPEKIKELKPVFDVNGTITAANSSPISDGASMLILMSKKKAKELKINPIAEIKAFNDSSHKPKWFTTAPSKSINELLSITNKKINDIDLFEINEAFATVTLANMRILGLKRNVINIYGGAVAIGHPLGCSGARIISTLIHNLIQEEKSTGIASSCNGGGGSTSIMINTI
jgi:acetyl-CoA C-acetyltransferase